MPAGFLNLGELSSARRLRTWSWSLALWLCAVFLWPALASAQTSAYCPTPLTATVANSAAASINVSSCDGPSDGGMRGPIAPFAVNGTVTIGPNDFGVQYVNYAHNGNSATSDVIWLEDIDLGTVRIDITITPPPSAIVVSPVSLPTITAGTPFSLALSSTGGVSPYTYSHSAGNLPIGLSLSSVGVLSGTPTQRGGYIFSVRSQDNAGDYIIKGYTGTVQNPTLSISPTAATAIQGVAFSQTLAAAGGVAPHFYQLETGLLPAGISISSAGVVSGTTAAAPGNYPVTLRVTDASTGPGSYFETEAFTFTVSPPPSVSIAVSPASVSEDGAANLVYTVTRSLNLASPTGVNITTAGTATSGTDYTGGVATVSIPAGATTATITIDPALDSAFEASETVILTVAAGTGYSVGAPASATGTIDNDDPLPSLSINDVTVVEGNAGTVSAVFTVTLSAASGQTVSVNYASADGTAVAPGDYIATSGTLTFTPGQTTQTLTVLVAGEVVPEANETFTVGLSGATNATIADATGVGTITNDDVPVTVSPATLPNGAVAAAYSQTLTASGGVPPHTFAVTAGALPAGLTLSSGGVLSGTPTAGGTFSFTVTATDSSAFPGPFAGSRAYTLVVTAPTIALPAASLAGGTVSAAYSASITAASGGTSPYSYAVTAGALPGGLTLSAASGAITGTPSAAGTFNFSITATDSSTGTGPYTATQSYSITVIDIPPVANAVSLTVAYNAGATPVTLNITGGTPTSVAVGTAPTHGTAIASGASITYQPTTGYAGPDSFTYTAANGGGTSAPATVTVTVSDPVITFTASAGFAATVGAPYAQTITLFGGAQPWSGYQVTGLPAGLSITGTTANSVTVSGTPTQAGSFAATGSATDSSTGNGPFTFSQVFVLTVGAPGLGLAPAATTFNAPYAAPYSQSFTASGGTGPYSYAITAGTLPTGVTLSSGGALTGAPTQVGSFNFTVTATDSSTGTGAPFLTAQSYTLIVGAPTIVVTPASLPNPAVGTPYIQTITASGGAAPYSFALTVGSLPAGITLGSGGALTGTPTQVGSFSFTVTATDNFGQVGSRAYTLVVGAPTLTMSPAAGALTAPYGVAYSQVFTASGSPGPYTYALTGALPTGVTFSGNLLAGTPTAPGSYPITMTATDTGLTGAGAPFSVAQNHVLTVAAPTLVVTPTTLPEPVAGEPYSQLLTASGGVAPYTFALTGGSLPTGLSLSASGLLSGTATQVGTFNISVTITDANGQLSVFNFELKSNGSPRQTLSKQVSSNADEDRNGKVSLNDTLTYRITLSNTGFVPLSNVVVSDARIEPGSITCTSVLPGQFCVLQGTYTVTAADVRARRVVNVATVSSAQCAPGSQDAQCRVTLSTQVIPAVVRAKNDDFGEIMCPKGDVIVGNAYKNDTIDGQPIRAAEFQGSVVSAAKPTKPGKPVPELNTATGDVKVPAGTPGGSYSISYKICQRSVSNNCDTATIVVKIKQCQVLVRVIKTANVKQTRVGDFVSYTLQIDNLSENDTEVEGLQIVDTPPPGFSLVPGSARFQDRNAGGTVTGTGPITLDQIDLAGNGKAFITYVLRVGANARRGDAVNTAVPLHEGTQVGSTAKALVAVSADPDTDETSIIGKVFIDQDGDGWQDSADAYDVRIQGGIDASVYVAGSTTVDRGQGAQPEPDASAPLLHGIRIGTLRGRGDADPATPLSRVVISQWLTAPVFVGDSVITSGQGTRVTVKPGGEVVYGHEGDVAAGLGSQDLRVERTVTPVDGKHRVDYILTNRGVSELGLPGVRLASPEGLVVQTDSYGRFHLEGIDAAARMRGRNFVLKLDPVSLPQGARVTTENPLVRRLTGGLAVRFDFGVGFDNTAPAAVVVPPPPPAPGAPATAPSR